MRGLEVWLSAKLNHLHFITVHYSVYIRWMFCQVGLYLINIKVFSKMHHKNSLSCEATIVAGMGYCRSDSAVTYFQNPDEPLKVRQFQLIYWPRDIARPDRASVLCEVLDKIQNWQKISADGPITIQCMWAKWLVTKFYFLNDNLTLVIIYLFVLFLSYTKGMKLYTWIYMYIKTLP